LKRKRTQITGIDQIPAELIKAGSRTIRSEIHKLINSIWNKKEFPLEWKESIIVPLYKKGDKKDCIIIQAHHFWQLRTKCYPTFRREGQIHKQWKLLGIISVDFDATGQLLILYSAFVQYFRKNGNMMKQCKSYL